MSDYQALKACLQTLASPSYALQQAVFFKNGPGEYSEHDRFMGIRVPGVRQCVKKYSKNLSLDDISPLLASPYNDERLCALLIAIERYQKNPGERTEIYSWYCHNMQHVNNWNLVDASAHLIVGAYLHSNQNITPLVQWAQSPKMWERRIAIVATWHTIKLNELNWTIRIAELLLRDEHDLIHKATGWMLREAGKKCEVTLTGFLHQHAHHMPRTMLRYALEKFPSDQRLFFMKKRS